MEIIKAHIRDIPDFPKPGILFKDITPILKSPKAFRATVDALVEQHGGDEVELICGVESRGFLFGAAMAYQMGLGFVPVRKPGKLPYKTVRESYSLEYGQNTLEMHIDAVGEGQRVLIIDDLLATGGTAKAAANLIRKQGASVVGFGFVVELGFLKGREQLEGAEVRSLLTY